MLIGAATIGSAFGFVVFGAVDWTAAAPLALGMFAGSTIGPSVTRRVDGNVLRVLVALTGLGLAILWLVPA